MQITTLPKLKDIAYMSVQFFHNTKKGLAKNVLKFETITNKNAKMSFVVTVTDDLRRINFKAKRSLSEYHEEAIKAKAQALKSVNKVGLFGFRLEQSKKAYTDKNGKPMTCYTQHTDTRVVCWAYPSENNISVEINWNGESLNVILPLEPESHSNCLARSGLCPSDVHLESQLKLKQRITNIKNKMASDKAKDWAIRNQNKINGNNKKHKKKSTKSEEFNLWCLRYKIGKYL